MYVNTDDGAVEPCGWRTYNYTSKFNLLVLFFFFIVIYFILFFHYFQNLLSFRDIRRQPVVALKNRFCFYFGFYFSLFLHFYLHAPPTSRYATYIFIYEYIYIHVDFCIRSLSRGSSVLPSAGIMIEFPDE